MVPSAQRWCDRLAAQLALLWARVVVWRRPRGSLVRRGSHGTPEHHSGPVDPTIERLARAMRRASRDGLVRPTCLVRAVALARLLAVYGYPNADIRVGVRRDGDRMLAHAWVVYDGVVVGEDERTLETLVELSDAEIVM